MRRLRGRAALAVAAAAALTVLSAAGLDDPLISLSYLCGPFTQTVEQRTDQRLEQAGQQAGQTPAAPQGSTAKYWQEALLKEGDALLAKTGTGVILLSGAGQVDYDAGAVVDVTAGSAVPSGTALIPNHRYLTAEDTAARFSVSSASAVLDYQGPYDFAYSQAVDYAAMAGALKHLGLFRGTFTGYGQGFDLQSAPTRLQALIMFIRVLGEEQQALSWTGTTPFGDIAPGSQAERYVGYAYAQGYTNGYSADTFRPGGSVNAYQYTEFALRALGYSSAENKDLSATLERAEACGVLTGSETAALARESFLRAQLVYVSYRALEASLPQGAGTLGQRLSALGLFSLSDWETARSRVSAVRL